MGASSGPIAVRLPGLDALAAGAARARDTLALTRPRVLGLVIFTAPPAMALGRDAWPPPGIALGALAGTALVAAGASAWNAVFERESDARMERTRERPLPAGRLGAAPAAAFAAATSALGLAVLAATGGALAAGLGALVLFHYAVVYTLWLKPRTPQSIVIGGAAGAAAPLLADVAVDGRLGAWGLALFLLVFLWTPPHFWAIALLRKRDYAAAGLPMMPAVVGDRGTRRRMLAYGCTLLPVSLLPWLGGALGPVYAAIAGGAGVWFVAVLVRTLRRAEPAEDRRAMFASILYLSVVFGAMLGELALRTIR
jgi:protoheme IX farnesyltransferase